MKTLFTPKEVAQIIGISYRQIQYWDSSGFIRPSYRRRGRFRSYTFGDLILLRVAKELRGHGYSIQKLRRVIAVLAGLVARAPTDQLDKLTFLLEDESVLVFTGEVLMDQGSQDQFFVFQVESLRSEVAEHFPSEELEVRPARPTAV